MNAGFRAAAAALCLAAAAFVIQAGAAGPAQSGAVQLQLGNEFLAEGRYDDALEAFKRALTLVQADDIRSARAGVVQSALRVAEFDLARVEAEALVAASPTSPDAIALYADALWSS